MNGNEYFYIRCIAHFSCGYTVAIRTTRIELEFNFTAIHFFVRSSDKYSKKIIELRYFFTAEDIQFQNLYLREISYIEENRIWHLLLLLKNVLNKTWSSEKSLWPPLGKIYFQFYYFANFSGENYGNTELFPIFHFLKKNPEETLKIFSQCENILS